MSADAVPQPEFFVTGGTIPPGASSYVERAADAELFEGLSAGEYCYVLNSRQMGKSSLAVHTIDRLRKAGIRCAFIDFTRIGGSSVSLEQWYAGLLVECGRALGLRSEAASFITKNAAIGPSQRFVSFIQEVALNAATSPLVIFIDEVDAARGLSFNTDELFAGIRQLHNGRASDAELNRLTFCLLGAALPSDLIRDPRTTPFNVGHRIELRDFTSQEALPFAAALGPNGSKLLDRVLYWTGGHPYLTQTICAQLAATPSARVDDLVRTRYLDERAKETDSNLADIGNRLIGRGDPAVGKSERADILSAYDKVLNRKTVRDDESNLASARIKMSGAARIENNSLVPRNRIYEHAFGKQWVRENMPGEELRRQRLAYMTGVIRTASVSGVVLTVVSALALIALRNSNLAMRLEHQAQIDRDVARYGEYVSTMRNMNELRSQHNLMLISRALDTHRLDLWRGWEWNYWNRFAHREVRLIDTGLYGTGVFHISPNGTYGIAADGYGVGVFDVKTGTAISQSNISSESVEWLHDSKQFLASGTDGVLRLYDAQTGHIVAEKRVAHLRSGSEIRVLPGDREALTVTRDGPVRIALPTLEATPFPHEADLALNGNHEDVSRDGTLVMWHVRSGDGHTLTIRQVGSGKTVRDIEVGENFAAIGFSADAKFVGVGTITGTIRIFEVSSGLAVSSNKVFSAPIQDLTFSPDGTKLAASGKDRQGALFRFEGRGIKLFRRFQECGEMEFVPGANEISVPYWSTRIYSLEADPDVPQVNMPPDFYIQSLFTKNGDLIVSDGAKFRSAIYTATGPQVVPSTRTDFALDFGLQLNVSKGHVRVTDGSTKETLIDVAEAPGISALFSPSGAIVTSHNHVITFHPPKAGATPVDITTESVVSAIACSPNNRYVAVSCNDGSISLYKALDGSRMWRTYDSKRCVIRDFAFSPNGKLLGAASNSDLADIYELRTGHLKLSLIGHSQSATSIAWSPDGTRIATGSDDTSIRLWDARTGADFGIVGNHELAVIGLRFVQDGKTLASYGLDGSVKYWLTKGLP